MAMKKLKIEEVEDDDRDAVLELMEQRAKPIQGLKHQKSVLERKLAELRNLMALAEAKYLRLNHDAISKTNPEMPGKNGAKTANETPSPQPRSEMKSFILPPSFKPRASASARAQVNEITQAQPMKEKSGPEAKRSPSFPNEAVRETQSQYNEAQSMATI